MTQYHAKVWNVEQVDGVRLKVATIEHGERKENPMCEGCRKPYCCHALRPVLTGEEFTTRRFLFRYVDLPDWLAPQLPNAQKLAVLAVDDEKGCPYLTGDCCSLWPNPPAACLGYDCREEDRPEAMAFCVQRTQEWMAQQGSRDV